MVESCEPASDEGRPEVRVNSNNRALCRTGRQLQARVMAALRKTVRILPRAGLLLVVMAILGTSCDSTAGAPQSMPGPTATIEYEQEDDMFIVEPVSAPIEEGVVYEFEIHTHCGLDAAWVDVDGSLWDFDGPMGGGDSARLDGFDDPSDEGTVELMEDGRLRFTSSGGADAFFTRHDGTKKIRGCR